MSVSKANPKLFGTCRLCLKDMGQYLIVPELQEQIKYCFEINVEPFDGLPQLLCNKCDGIIKDFYETKKKIVDKQNDFINKLHIEKTQKQCSEKANVPKQNHSESEPQKASVAKRKQIVLSFSCSKSDQSSHCTATKNKKDTKKSVSWPSDYNKLYACRLCNYRGRKKLSIVRHTNLSHKNLKLKHQRILNNNCIIKLDKLDKLPNITGLDNTVVISRDTIVQDIDKNYCIIYTSKNSDCLFEIIDKSDNSDDEDTVRKKQKISDETLKLKKDIQQTLINRKDELKEMGNGDCIKIDDSSDSASEKNCNSIKDEANSNNAVSLQQVFPTITMENYCTKIQNIISICHNKYKKNIDLHKLDRKQSNDPALSKSQLKHKVLSIGRKIINKQGFNCTGLLRYMEHRNLEIVWTPNISNYNTDTNYVRIMTKLSANLVNEDEMGWKSCKLENKVNHTNHTISGDVPMPKISQVFYSDKNMHWKVDNKTTKLLNENPVANPKQLPKKTVVIENLKDSVPDTLTQSSPNNIQHISKQKQFSDTAGSMPDLSPMTSEDLHNNSIYEQNITIQHKENDTSALPNNVNNDTEISAGRIKVKPLAELLSKEGFMNTFVLGNPTSSKPLYQDKQSPIFTCTVKENDFIQSSHITQPSYISLASQVVSTSSIIKPSQTLKTNDIAQTNYTFATIHAVQPTLIVQTKEINPTVPSNKRKQLIYTAQQSQIQTNQQLVSQCQSSSVPTSQTEFVIMDTVELPSTKTNSPIKYLENLLLIHDINLLDQTKQELSKSFVCLIKFKVMYKQETMEEPILLSLSLFCHKNNFCMKVKNVNQESINVSKISANWQWEIIKVFKGDVSNKLLQNAQKVNQETYEYAKTFLCLLKSINYTKV